MRLIGYLDTESAARQFSDYLVAERIANHLEHSGNQGWAIWVEEEDEIAKAGEKLAGFRANPSAAEFQGRSTAAAAIRAKQQKEAAAYTKRVVARRELFRPLAAYGFGPLTFGLIAISVLVFFWSKFGADEQRVMPLYISNFWVEGSFIRWFPNLPEVRHGQIWRLVTPIFIHGNVLHILFNMLWLRDLGSMIEARQSTAYFAVLVLALAVGSNLGQYYFGHGPAFGGMSGVVYGLLGYVWLRGKFDPASGLFLHPTTVTLMIIWFVACWTVLSGVANMAHTVGLLMGMAWGYLASQRYR